MTCPARLHDGPLTGPWRKVIGPIHPDDEELS